MQFTCIEPLFVWGKVRSANDRAQALANPNGQIRSCASTQFWRPSGPTNEVVLKGIEQLWQHGPTRYFDYIKRNIDTFVEPDGTIRTYSLEEYNLDQISTGKLLFGLWDETCDERYRQAALRLRDQLRTHPRTSSRASGTEYLSAPDVA